MLLHFKHLAKHPRLVHAVSSRQFDGMDGFNIADHVGQDAQNAIANRARLCTRLKLDLNRLTVGQQVHKANVVKVTSENVGRGSGGWKSGIADTDALITNLTATPIMVLSADCPLILVYDPVNNAIGTIHASWRCTFAGIIGRTIAAMVENFHSDPMHMIAGIGPGAGPCCYQIDEQFIKTIAERPELLPFIIHRVSGQYYDLWSAGQSELVRAGLPAENIEKMGICTICNEQFFSFRRQAAEAGRFGLIAAIQ